MATSVIQTRFDVGTESAELWRVGSSHHPGYAEWEAYGESNERQLP